MSGLPKDIENQALSLSAIDRLGLAEKLLSSLDLAEQEEIDRKWAEESEERIAAYDSGQMQATDASSVFERIENTLP